MSKKSIGEIYRLDQDSCELFEVKIIQDVDGYDRITFQSTSTLNVRSIDEFSFVYPHQGPEIDYTVPKGSEFFERVYVYFSKNAKSIGVAGDDIEYFRDNRNGQHYVVACNEDKEVFQIAKFIGFRLDERSRIPNEFTYDRLENKFLLRGDEILTLPFAIGWVRCWSDPEYVPEEFDWDALPAVRASDGASVLAVLHLAGKL